MQITRKGVPTSIEGPFVEVGDMIPDFTLIDRENKEISSKDLIGKRLLISVYPDINTSTCERQTRTFFSRASELDDIRILNVSNNTVEELNGWCATSGLNVDMTSDFNKSFEKGFGLYMPEFDVLARSIFIVDETGKIEYMEIVQDMAVDPNYDKAIEVANKKNV